MKFSRLAAWTNLQRSVWLTLFMTLALLASPAKAAPAAGDEAFARAAREAVDRIAREDGFSGVILIARGDQVLLRRAAGLADRERNIPNTPETRFSLQSVTKQFTAAAIMLLVQDGKLSLDDPVAKYYAAAPPSWNAVTIRHLLTHTAGIGVPFTTEDELRFRTYRDAVEIAAQRAPSFEPGARFQYSNAGYMLLTAVIESIAGQPYGDFLREHVFAPLGMRNTGYGAIPRGTMRGYRRHGVEGTWELLDPVNLDVLGGAGGIYSTLDDMLIWSRALDGDVILSPDSKTAMFTDYGYNYGFGWRFATKYGRRLVWHTGSYYVAGYASIFDRFPEEGLAVIVMTNNSGLTDSTATLTIEGQPVTFPANAARKLVEQVEKLYFGRDP
jgi:CubicO group peptidase (beta-lactamase class C family)